MNKNKFALTAMLLLVGFTMTTATEVPLQTDPPIIAEDSPKRAPGNRISLSVSIDEESQQLEFSDLSGDVYTYYIYDKDESIVAQGILDFSTNATLYLDLSFVECGTYTLNVVHNGKNYVGTFDLP